MNDNLIASRYIAPFNSTAVIARDSVYNLPTQIDYLKYGNIVFTHLLSWDVDSNDNTYISSFNVLPAVSEDDIFSMVLYNSGSTSVEFITPTVSTFTYNGHIRINGGTWKAFISHDDVNLTFDLASEVETLVEITGTFDRLYFNDGVMKTYPLRIHYGNIGFGNNGLENAFFGCSNLTELTGNGVIGENCWYAIRGCSNLESLGDLDVSATLYMYAMFYEATSFNQDIGSWDVSSVTTMAYMLYGTSSFNQYIGDWNVSEVNNMSYMFYNATSFNQDISNWDVSNVTNMTYMLYNSGISVTNYSNFLLRCKELGESGNLQYDVSLGATPIRHNGTAHAAITYLVDTWGWSITDGGLES